MKIFYRKENSEVIRLNKIISELKLELHGKDATIDILENSAKISDKKIMELEYNATTHDEMAKLDKKNIDKLKTNVKELDKENEKIKTQSKNSINKLNDEIIQLKHDAKKKDLDTELKNSEDSIRIKDLEGEVARYTEEVEYQKKLIGTLREFPEFSTALKNLQTLAVPGLKELKTFADIVNNNELTGLIGALKSEVEELTKATKSEREMVMTDGSISKLGHHIIDYMNNGGIHRRF